MADDAEFLLPLSGGCRCGRIRYSVTGAPLFIFACHCTDCQQLSASAFSLGMAVDDAAFQLEGEPHRWTKTGLSGKPSHQFTCPDCAGWTHTKAEAVAGMTVVRPITLDEHRWVRPVAQIYTRSALPWALMPAQFSFDEEFKDPRPLQAAFALGGIRPR